MRKRTAIASAAAILVAVIAAWYWASPFFAVASLRNAAIRADTNALNERVDFSRVRDELKTQLSSLLISKMTDNLRGNPFAAIGVAIAAKLTDVMVDAMVSPAGIAALVKAGSEKTPAEVSGFRLMMSTEVAVHRYGLDAFDFYSVNNKEKLPTLRFAREGLSWRLTSVQMPKEFLASEIASRVGANQPTVPYAAKWEYFQSKDAMDDTVTTILTRGADQEVTTQFAKVRPDIIFRCRQNTFDAYINVHSSADYDYETHRSNVRLRFDENTAVSEKWDVSTDREALFAPNAKTFLNSLLQANSLRFEWPQSGGGRAVATFNRGDLGVQVAKFAKDCGQPEITQAPAQDVLNEQAWVVTLDAYSDEKDVEQLRTKLSAAGIKSYAETVKTSRGELTRVSAGPFASKEAADTAHTKLVAMGLKTGAIARR